MEPNSESNPKIKLSRTTRISLIICALSSLLFAATMTFLSNSRLENIGQDILTALARQQTRLPDQVKVILIDENSLQYMEPQVGRWPWPRRVFKDVIEFINLGGARAIHFDILFSERESTQLSQQNDDDTLLAQSSAEAANVIHAMQLLREDNQDQIRQPLPELVAHRALTVAGNNLIDTPYRDYLAPFPALLDASMGIGIVNAGVDDDGIYRSTRPFYRYGDHLLPALSIAGALKLNDERVGRLVAGKDSINAATAGMETSRLVNFYADVPAYSLSGVIASAQQIQRGDSAPLLISPEEFADSYVFIGASAIGLHDLKPTPMSALTPGVFVHASYLANLLSHDVLHQVNPALVYVALPVLALTIALVVLTTRHMSVQLLAPLVLIMLYLTCAYFLRRHNMQIAISVPLLCIVVSWLSAYAYLFSVEERERKQVRAMFSRYVSPAALTVLLKQMENARSAASGSREYISVLFCDMRGFTTLAERLPAEDTVRVLNYYFSIMTDIVFRHGGTVDKFIGDAIMATWGAPLPSQSHALDAVRCSLSMRAAVPDINDWLRQQQLPDINIGIGIHSGEAIMGSLGSQQKADFTVIGDTVNMASRLEGVTKIYRRTVVISENTWNEVHHHIDCQLLDCIKVKGKLQASKIYSPLAEPAGAQLDHKRIVVTSEQAFDLYQKQQWQACLALLKQLPQETKLAHLEKRCIAFQQQAPEADWQAVHTLQSK